MDETINTRFNSLFADQTETFICALGGSFAEEYIDESQRRKNSKDSKKDGFAVMSDERVYIKGKYFLKGNKSYYMVEEDINIAIEDITETGIVYNNPLRFITVAMILLFAAYFAIIMMASGFSFFLSTVSVVVTILFLIIVLILSFVYRVNRQELFEITFAGNTVALRSELFYRDEILEFEDSLRLVQDRVSPDLLASGLGLPYDGSGVFEAFEANGNAEPAGSYDKYEINTADDDEDD